MRRIVLLIFIFLIVLTACQSKGQGSAGANGASGVSGKNGADGKDGLDGKNGLSGLNGQNAAPCSVTQTETGAVISCPDGTAAVILNGKDGLDCEEHAHKHKHGHE